MVYDEKWSKFMLNSIKSSMEKNNFNNGNVEQNWIFCTRPHFNLRKPHGEMPSTIYLTFKVGGKQYKISTNVKVIPSHFNRKTSTCLISPTLSEVENQNNFIANNKILELKTQFFQFICELCKVNRNEYPQFVKKYFANSMKKKSNKRASAVILQCLMDQKMKESSYGIYRTVYDTFIKFLKSINKTDLEIDDINLDLMKEFKKFLQKRTVTHPITSETVYVTDDNVAENLNKFLTLLNYCDKNDCFDLSASKCLKIKDNKKEVHTYENKIYISEDEENLLLNHPFTGDEADVANVFIFQIESLQRFSDIEKLMGVDIRTITNNGMITLRQKKTGTQISFPVSPIMQLILERVDYILPKITNAKCNKILKDICKTIGLNEICDCVEERGGELYKYSCEKYKLVTTHSARRSGITQSLQSGLSTELVGKISGHKSVAMVQRYDRTESEVAATLFAEKRFGGVKTPEVDSCPESVKEPVKSQENELFKGLTPQRIINDIVYFDKLGNAVYMVDENGHITKLP